MGNNLISSFLFQPPRMTRCLKPDRINWLSTKLGNQIPIVHIQRPSAKLTVLYSHANAEDLSDVYVWLKHLSKQLDVNIVGYDYSGYGQSTGEPSEENCYADAEAVFDYLNHKCNVSTNNIVLFGRSLGSGPSVFLASTKQNVAGLILHSPFASVYRVIADVGCTLPTDKFANIDLVSFVQCRVLLIHGTDDNIIPHHHSENLYNAIPKSSQVAPLYLEGMGHNSIPEEYRPIFIQTVKQFLEQHCSDVSFIKTKDYTAVCDEAFIKKRLYQENYNYANR